MWVQWRQQPAHNFEPMGARAASAPLPAPRTPVGALSRGHGTCVVVLTLFRHKTILGSDESVGSGVEDVPRAQQWTGFLSLAVPEPLCPCTWGGFFCSAASSAPTTHHPVCWEVLVAGLGVAPAHHSVRSCCLSSLSLCHCQVMVLTRTRWCGTQHPPSRWPCHLVLCAAAVRFPGGAAEYRRSPLRRHTCHTSHNIATRGTRRVGP